MPHSGFGATLNPDQLQKFDPPPPSFFRHSNFFQLDDHLGSSLIPHEHLCVRSRPFSGRVSRFAEFFNVFVLYLGKIGKYLYNNYALCGSYLYNVCTLFKNYLEYMFTI